MANYTSKIKSYEIDLSLPEDKRWQQVINKEIDAAKGIIKSNEQSIWHGSEVYQLSGKFLKPFYERSNGLYIGEMKSWADATDYSYEKILALNCQYSLNHLYEWILGNPSERIGELKNKVDEKIKLLRKSLHNINKNWMGCTSAIKWIDGYGMVHLRNMDWPLSGIGNATRVFIYKKGSRKFITVGVVGMVGVLSGMLPGKYSITINYAPVKGMRHTISGYDPLVLLREVFEQCNSFDEAVRELSSAPLMTNVFYIVCGFRKGQACVIERTKDDKFIRRSRTRALSQANHFNSKKFNKYNKALKYLFTGELYEDSPDRQNTLLENLEKLNSKCSGSKIVKCLSEWPIENSYSYQKMIFFTTTGEYKVWRWIDNRFKFH